MAVRFDAASENYTATNGLPSNVYTFCAWIYPTNVSSHQSLFWLTDASDVFTGIAIRDTGDLQGVDGGSYGFNGINPLAASVNTWYRVALVVNGANVTFYRSTASAALASGSVADGSPAATPTQWTIGDNPYDEFFNGRLAAVKIWQAALAAAEVQNELAQYAPIRTANLLRFHPFVKPETVDYSGNGNTLSGGTGTSVEDGPPIPWRVTSSRLIIPPAAGGGTSLAINTASEVDSGFIIGRGKVKAITAAVETDSGIALGRVKSRLLGLSTESDLSIALGRAKSKAIGLNTETDLAIAIGSGDFVSFNTASETDIALPVGRLRTRPISTVVETDAAGEFTRPATRWRLVLPTVAEEFTVRGSLRVKSYREATIFGSDGGLYKSEMGYAPTGGDAWGAIPYNVQYLWLGGHENTTTDPAIRNLWLAHAHLGISVEVIEDV